MYKSDVLMCLVADSLGYCAQQGESGSACASDRDEHRRVAEVHHVRLRVVVVRVAVAVVRSQRRMIARLKHLEVRMPQMLTKNLMLDVWYALDANGSSHEESRALYRPNCIGISSAQLSALSVSALICPTKRKKKRSLSSPLCALP